MSFLKTKYLGPFLSLGLFFLVIQSTGCRGNLESKESVSAASRNISWIAEGVRVKGPGLLGSGAEALLWATQVPTHRSLVILSPGGKVPPEAMSGLAASLAATGRIVFVMQYLQNLGIIPGQSGKIAELSTLLKDNPSKLTSLPSTLVDELKGGQLPMSLFGHSMGGAILGNYISEENAIFEHIALYSVNSFVSNPAKVAVKNLKLFIGSKDGLMLRDQEAQEKVKRVEALLSTQRVTLPELNHFCIISDDSVGDPSYREKDFATNLTSKQCIAALTESLDSFLP